MFDDNSQFYREINNRFLKKVPFLGTFFDLFLPNYCLICNNIISSENFVCHECFNKLINLKVYPFKEKISQKVDLYYFGSYDGILSKFILKYKYENHRSLASFLALCVGKLIKHWNIKDDLITNVPSHKLADRKRGFSNTGLVLKRMICEMHTCSEYVSIFKRDGKYLPQASIKDPVKRKENAENSYSLKSTDEKFIERSNTLTVIDDVYTTGATLRKITDLVKKDFVKINCVVVARKKI